MPSDRLTAGCMFDRLQGGGVTDERANCQLYAVIEAVPAAAERLSAALGAAELAAVLIVPAPGEVLAVGTCKPLVGLAKQSGVATLLLADAQLARTLDADGVH